jgi:outer membrane lipoprotein-sorting protein
MTRPGRRGRWTRVRMRGMIAIILLTSLVACSRGQEPSPLLQQAVERTLAASSFHAMRTATGSFPGMAPPRTMEIVYQAPDRIRLMPTDGPRSFDEAIMIGTEAWMRQGEEWTVADQTVVGLQWSIPLESYAGIFRSVEAEDEGAGPEQAGEPTRRFQLHQPDYGKQLAAVQDDLARSRPAVADDLRELSESIKDVTATITVLVGEETGRLYAIAVDLEGSQHQYAARTQFDAYEAPVTIEPPLP